MPAGFHVQSVARGPLKAPGGAAAYVAFGAVGRHAAARAAGYAAVAAASFVPPGPRRAGAQGHFGDSARKPLSAKGPGTRSGSATHRFARGASMPDRAGPGVAALHGSSR